MISFWERDMIGHVDFIIVGAGIIGISTAISLRLRHKHARIVIVERGAFPTGASTRNAGFACFGSLTELAVNVREWGENTTYAIVEKRKKGLELLRKRLGSDGACGYEHFGGYELLSSAQEHHRDSMGAINTLLTPVFGSAPFIDCTHSMHGFGFGKTVTGMIYCPFEGQIHSGKTMASLAMYAQQMGIDIVYGVTVDTISSQGHGVDIEVRTAPMDSYATLTAEYCVVCTNAMIPSLIPDIPILPGRGQVLITSPIDNLPFQGVFHYDEGYYYFRNVGKRVLLGGGRNMDFVGEATNDFALTDTIQEALERLLRDVIVPKYEYKIEQRWSGIMGFSNTKLPIVRFVNARTAIGFGCNGMGVALGSMIGEETANLFD